MNWLIFTSGVLAAITALVHIVVGGKQIARPLLGSQLDSVVKLTMYACWHLVSISLVLSSTALLACGTHGGAELASWGRRGAAPPRRANRA